MFTSDVFLWGFFHLPRQRRKGLKRPSGLLGDPASSDPLEAFAHFRFHLLKKLSVVFYGDLFWDENI